MIFPGGKKNVYFLLVRFSSYAFLIGQPITSQQSQFPPSAKTDYSYCSIFDRLWLSFEHCGFVDHEVNRDLRFVSMWRWFAHTASWVGFFPCWEEMSVLQREYVVALWFLLVSCVFIKLRFHSFCKKIPLSPKSGLTNNAQHIKSYHLNTISLLNHDVH